RGVGPGGSARGRGESRELRSTLRRAPRARRSAAPHLERERSGGRRATALGPPGGRRMCHPEVPAGTPLPNVRTEEVAIELVNGEGMSALIAWPERTPAPAVLVINDVFGRSEFYEHLTRRLAQPGFVAGGPGFFLRPGA